MPDCIFCKIIKGEIPCNKIYEDKDTLAFLDINPVNPGHVLVIPKEHYKLMHDVPDETLSKVFIKSKDLMTTIKKATKADYVAVSIVGLDVPHFHVHLVPRYFNDGMAAFWPTKKYNEGEAEKLAIKIKSLLK
ncbi:MAG: HIT family protein [Candidatus Nanoarchaeia archaeon]|nr:HIT family protein [Candidatus Nanoarchaeia archaeon]